MSSSDDEAGVESANRVFGEFLRKSENGLTGSTAGNLLARVNIQLNEDEYELLCQQDPATEKDGGYQGLMVKLQERTNEATGELELTEDDIERIQRYAFNYNRGGWQERLKAIFARSLGPDLNGEVS